MSRRENTRLFLSAMTKKKSGKFFGSVRLHGAESRRGHRLFIPGDHSPFFLRQLRDRGGIIVHSPAARASSPPARYAYVYTCVHAVYVRARPARRKSMPCIYIEFQEARCARNVGLLIWNRVRKGMRFEKRPREITCVRCVRESVRYLYVSRETNQCAAQSSAR